MMQITDSDTINDLLDDKEYGNDAMCLHGNKQHG